MDILNFFDNHTQWFILGKGSNSLILESALAIPFIKLGSSFQKITNNNDYLLAKAGASVPQLMSFSQKNGLSGLEFMAGVPASLGGMIAMNFGCWDVCMQDIVHSVDLYIPGQGFVTFSNEQCQFGYRTSIFQSMDCLILSAKLSVSSSDPSSIKKTIHHYVTQRLTKQPMRTATFGSIFKNPAPDPAAAVIEKSGLKGYQLRTAKVSELHANFMENIADASSQDALDLMALIQKEVKSKFNISLQPEVSIFQ